MVGEWLSRAGVFEGMQRYAGAISAFYVMLRDRIVESSNTIGEVVGVLETSYFTLLEFIDPWCAAGYLASVLFLVWFWRVVTQDCTESSTSSLGQSPASLAEDSPASMPRDRAGYHVTAGLLKAVDQQSLWLQKLVERQDSILERHLETCDEDRAFRLLQAVMRESEPARNLWGEITKRVATSEETLKADGVGGGGVEIAANGALQVGSSDDVAGLAGLGEAAVFQVLGSASPRARKATEKGRKTTEHRHERFMKVL